MKSNCKVVAAFFVFVVLVTASTGVIAEEKTKEYNEVWTASSVQTLEIDNKFGDIKINNRGGSEVTIDVLITVDAPNEAKAEELLELINVEFYKSGSTVSAETTIDPEFKSRQKFSIDYEVNIPSDKNLDISNKYGNTVVGDLNASGEFKIGYGNFTANELNAPESGKMELNLEYGKADVSVASDIEVVVKYSTMNFGELDDLLLDSKYTVVNIEQGSSVNANSRYDTFNFEEVASVTAESKYTHFKIGELSKSLKIDAGYGGIRVDEVSSGFESINITNSYGHIAIGLDNASYLLDAECDYCGVDYPEDKFAGDRINEKNTRIVKGKVGTRTGGTVVLKSRYGQIMLKD